jgi:putative ABC transport system permease protein
MKALRLALADLTLDRVPLACLAATIAGVVVPLAMLLGVKSGVFGALVDELRRQPGILQVTMPGDRGFSRAEAAEVAGWPETGFVAPDIRAIARRLEARRADGGRIRRMALVPTGPDDPALAGLPPPTGRAIAASAPLAAALDLAPGATIVAMARRGDPPTAALALELTVAAVLPRAALEGEAALMDPATMELVEAFYDGYALPEFGVPDGRPLAERAEAFESLRLYARDLESVASLEARVRARFDVPARSRAAEVASVLRLGRNLDLAFSIIAATALGGLAAALVASFWAGVQRKRATLALLGLVGLTPLERAMFPVVQALVVALAGLALSAVALGFGAAAARRLFASELPEGASVVALGAAEMAALAGVVVALCVAASFFAARAAARVDPAEVLRGS